MTILTIQIPQKNIDVLKALKSLLSLFKGISFEIKEEKEENNEEWDTVFTEENKKARKKALEELEKGETFSIDALKKSLIKDGYEV
jgi:flagellar motor component MotA